MPSLFGGLAVLVAAFAIWVLPSLVVRRVAGLTEGERLKARNDARLAVIQIIVGIGLLTGLVLLRHKDRTIVLLWALSSVAVLAVGAVLFFLPNVLVDPVGLEKPDLLEARHNVRTSGIQILGGLILLGGLFFTYLTTTLNRTTLNVTQQGQITDRFSKATDQLGSDKLDIQLGGIYSMERIARDSKNDQGPVMEVLTAFVREHAPTSTASATVTTDVQAVLTVVGRRNINNDPTDYMLDLDHTNLNNASLIGAHLAGADLSGAFLNNALLNGAKLRNAKLRNAKLKAAQLIAADLRGVNLTIADLSSAHLTRADLSGGADLTDAILRGAYLEQAYLTGANLKGAHLDGAHLTGANLKGADLGGADLRGAHLSGAEALTQGQLDSAITDKTTMLPPGLRAHD